MKRVIFYILLIGLGIVLLAQEDKIRLVKILPINPSIGELYSIFVISDPDISTLVLETKNSKGLVFAKFKAASSVYGPIKMWTFLCSISSLFSEAEILAEISSSGKILKAFPIKLTERSFFSETIVFNKSMSDLKTIPNPKKDQESEQLLAILNTFNTNQLYPKDGFVFPLSAIRKTAYFADRRIYSYQNGLKENTIHHGTDFGGNKLAVYSSGTGKVVFADRRIVTGNTIIIQHAPGLYALYYHLDSLQVKPGQQVTMHELIGLSGASGLVTGPHLHWEFRNQGQSISPESLIAQSDIDINSLVTVLSLPLLP